MNDLAIRDSVIALQAELLKFPQLDIPTAHVFHGGLYARIVEMKAGTVAVGLVHKTDHLFMVVSGTVRLTTGDGAQTIEGPRLIQSTAGTKRAVCALTDALCMNFHALPEMAVEEAEAELVESEPNSPYGIGNRLKDKVLS